MEWRGRSLPCPGEDVCLAEYRFTCSWPKSVATWDERSVNSESGLGTAHPNDASLVWKFGLHGTTMTRACSVQEGPPTRMCILGFP